MNCIREFRGDTHFMLLGAENLTAQRPAVFLFNHRNNFDVFMVAALVKDNWTGVAKKGLASKSA